MWIIKFGLEYFYDFYELGVISKANKHAAMQFALESDARNFKREYLVDEWIVIYDAEIIRDEVLVKLL